MAINKPVKKGTRQTEERSKGLVGYKGNKQINKGKSSANKSVGNYSGKTLNLTKKQLGARGQKAASAAKVDISQTTFDKSKGGVLGPKGKPLTGRVDLGGGNIAVYRNGVRVRAASKPSGGGGGGNGGGGGGGGASGDGKGTPMRPVPNRGTPMRPVPAAPTKKPPGNGTPMRPVKPRGTPQMQARAGGGRGFGMAAMGAQGKGKQMRGQTGRTGTSTKAEVAMYLAGAGLLPLVGLGGAGLGTAATVVRGGMAARAALAARNAAVAARGVGTPASRATSWGKGVPVATKVPPRGAPRVNSNLSPTGPGRGGVPNKKIGPTTTSRDTQWGKGIAVAKPAAKPAAKPRAKPAAKKKAG